MPWVILNGVATGWILSDVGGYGNAIFGDAIYGGEVGSGEWAGVTTPNVDWVPPSAGQLSWVTAPVYSAGWG